MLESLFNKVATLLKRDSNTGFFTKYCEILKNSFFYRTSRSYFFKLVVYSVVFLSHFLKMSWEY